MSNVSVDGYLYNSVDGYVLDGTHSSSVSFSSSSLSVLSYAAVSVHLVASATGSPAGTIALQYSNDGLSWVDTATPTAVSGAVNLVFSTLLPVKYVRVNYVRSGGAITLKCVYVVKS